jgi:hypothetical protein
MDAGVHLVPRPTVEEAVRAVRSGHVAALARLLVERGAAVSPWDAAALGMTDRVADVVLAGAAESRVPCSGQPATAATSTRRASWSMPAPTSTGSAGTP